MTSFWITITRFFVAFERELRQDPEFRTIFITLAGLLFSGTSFYSSVEGWSVIDALYFSVTTLATVGYGDLHPTTPLSKLFTCVYLLIGIGVFLAFLSKLSRAHRASKDRESAAD